VRDEAIATGCVRGGSRSERLARAIPGRNDMRGGGSICLESALIGFAG